MKKLLLSLAAVAMGFAASAQVSQGTIALGGSVFFESNDNGTTSGSVFGLGVNGGYFLSDGLELMAMVGFTGEDKAGTRGGNKSSMDFGVGAQKYFELASSFYLTGGASFAYNSGKTAADVSFSGMNIGVAPGFAWFPSENWGISMSMGNWIYYRSADNGTKTSGFGVTPNLGGLGLGVRYFLSK